jgi:hypothetical protein
MGDRANIAIEQGDGTRIWLYGHWSGWRMPSVLQNAIRRGRGRWDDTPYFGRIVFQALVGGDDGLTDFGITTSMTDNEYPILVCDCDTQTVSIESEEGRTPKDADRVCIGRTFSFEEFAALPDLTWGILDTPKDDV